MLIYCLIVFLFLCLPADAQQVITAAAVKERDRCNAGVVDNDLAFGLTGIADDQDINVNNSVSCDFTENGASQGVFLPAGTLRSCGFGFSSVGTESLRLRIYVNGGLSSLTCTTTTGSGYKSCADTVNSATLTGSSFVAASIQQGSGAPTAIDNFVVTCLFTAS